ncbi:FMN-binding negative transcriptional regulator [Lysinibacillus sphaericus]
MYIPKQFRLTDDQTVHDIIRENGFATLISQGDGLPVATHLPLQLNEDRTCLHGHFARPNPQWKNIEAETVLAIFHGPHCYISPSWYETDQTVPTWNYVTVHVYGKMELVHDTEESMTSLEKLVAQYESDSSPYSLENVDPDYIAGLTKGIQAFKLHITKIEAKAKLSQNHPAERRARVIRQLEQIPREDERAVAEWMKRSLK